ncbi:MAG: TlpA family protein disulfide reductase [Bryobacteraceae bacterium]|nr:TlpA family protein disulfide reductase [Bryobacterales bacterium]MEB2360972.1 TlpA disulfide reductase family protein [Bryobacterales bacterium]NUN03266.1 TlpA family protein disulfide reductase [Bryobacteraceae bacterium]
MKFPVALILCLAAAALPAPMERLSPLDESILQQVLKSNRGNVVLVNLWATWCAPCREEMPALVALQSRLASKGLKLVTVSADEPEDEASARQFLSEQKVPSPAYIKRVENDEKFIESLDPKWSGALPASFLYDRNGRKVRAFIGEVDMKELEAAIRKLL